MTGQLTAGLAAFFAECVYPAEAEFAALDMGGLLFEVDRAKDRAVETAEPTHYYHQQELDRKQHAKYVGSEKSNFVSK